MSKLSIYEIGWINLVFEGRNKEYGAYQLRKESSKNALTAFFIGLTLICFIATLPTIASHFNPSKTQPTLVIPDFTITPVSPSTLLPLVKAKTIVPKTNKTEKNISLKKDNLTNILLVHSSLADVKPIQKTENTNSLTVISDGIPSNNIDSKNILGNTTAQTTTENSKNETVESVALDQLPEFPGGINKFYNFVGNNFEETEIGEEKTIRIYVSFVIEKDGSMTNILVKKDPGYGLGKEAERVLKSLKTKWNPGILAGKAVRTAYNLPITIEIN
jgi:hypothetical protein